MIFTDARAAIRTTGAAGSVVVSLPRRQVEYRHGQWVVLDRQTGIEHPCDDHQTAHEHVLLSNFVDLIFDGILPPE